MPLALGLALASWLLLQVLLGLALDLLRTALIVRLLGLSKRSKLSGAPAASAC